METPTIEMLAIDAAVFAVFGAVTGAIVVGCFWTMITPEMAKKIEPIVWRALAAVTLSTAVLVGAGLAFAR